MIVQQPIDFCNDFAIGRAGLPGDTSPVQTPAHKADETGASPEKFDMNRRNRVQLTT